MRFAVDLGSQVGCDVPLTAVVLTICIHLIPVYTVVSAASDYASSMGCDSFVHTADLLGMKDLKVSPVLRYHLWVTHDHSPLSEKSGESPNLMPHCCTLLSLSL